MSFKNSSVNFLAAIGLILLPIVYLSSPLSFSFLRAGDVKSSFTEATDPITELPISRSNTTIILDSPEVEIGFAVDVSSQHVGIKYLKDLTDTKTIYFDEGKHLWTIALLDTAGTMTAAGSLHDISLDNSTIVCDTLKYTLKNGYPTSVDTSLLFNWVGVVDTTNFPNDTLNVDVLATIFGNEEDVSFSIRIVKADINSPEASLFNVDFPCYWVEEYSTSGANQFLAYPKGHGNLLVDPIDELDDDDGSDVLNQYDYVRRHRQMGFDTTWAFNAGLHPGQTNMQFFSYYNKSNSTGLYSATTDTVGYLKLFHLSGHNDDSTLECFTRHFPENNNSFFDGTYTLPYYYKMRAFEGDWVDASKIYREWLIDSPIVKDEGGTLGYRQEFLAIVDSMHYGLEYLPDTASVRDNLDFFYSPDSVQKSGGRMGGWGEVTPNYKIHEFFCGWINNPGDTLSPPALVDSIKAHHGIVGAYNRFRHPPWKAVVDTCVYAGSCSDDDSTTCAKSMVFSINGDTLFTENDCLYEVCNASKYWQVKFSNGVDSTVSNLLDANMIYIDTSGQPILCYRGSEHQHPDGGGSYSVGGMKDIVDSLNTAIAHPDSMVTANEAPHDIKIGWFNYYVTWGGFMGGSGGGAKTFPRLLVGADDIPLIPSVMHDNQATIMGLGRHCYSEPDDANGYGGNHWAFTLAYSFVSGSMQGFRQDTVAIASDSVQLDDYEYVRSLIGKRNDIRNYMVYGEWMRPPTLFDLDSTEVAFWDVASPELPAILSAAYLKVDSLGAELDSLGLALVFTNYSDTTLSGGSTASCSLSVDFSTYFSSVSPDSFQICELIFADSTLVVDSTRSCARFAGSVLDTTLTLASDSTAVFRIIPIEN